MLKKNFLWIDYLQTITKHNYGGLQTISPKTRKLPTFRLNGIWYLLVARVHNIYV